MTLDNGKDLAGNAVTKSFCELALELHGREFAMLSNEELQLFRVVRDTGRKFGLVATVEVMNDSDKIQAELAASSQQGQEDIYRRERTQVAIQDLDPMRTK